MRIQYNGIVLAGTGGNVAISGSALWTWDATITATSTATVVGANAAIMATLVAGVPYSIPGFGHQEWADDAQINLAQYSVNTAGGQTVYVAYSIRQ